MSVTAIILLIIFGIFLFLVEFLIVPGITVAGIGGAILLGIGIYLAFEFHGARVGGYVLAGTLAGIIITLIISLRSGTWKKLMLNTNVEGNTYNQESETIKPGDTGVALTRLNPIGKAMINEIVVEAKSTGNYINEKAEIVVVKPEGSKFIVKPKS